MTTDTAADLNGCHPRLIAAVQKIQEAARSLGFPLKVLEGLRTDDRQQTLYAQGRTTPGAIVTQCDGVIHRSRHQVQADGYGHAVDLVWDGEAPFEGPWAVLGAAAEALGLIWGGRFKTLVDRPHVELPTQEAD